jgi:hypothetical protein
MNKVLLQGNKLRTVLAAALFFVGGAVMAQNDRQYVIEKDGHYLAHVGTTLQDATTFDPATCLWYSSNNYNYYFMDGTARKYLKAPLALNGALSIGDNPGSQDLTNSTLNYFFWDWDQGLARGILHLEGGDCPPQYNSGSGQCWEVVWVSYEEGTWKMSSDYGYEPTANSARFLRVTITEHAEALSNEVGGVGNLGDFAMNYQDMHPLDGTATAFSCSYTPAYTQYHIAGLNDPDHNTNISEVSYYYYGDQYHTAPPTSTTYSNATPSGYAWSLSGDGAPYLSFQNGQNNIANPTLVYSTQNTTSSHQYATLTLTVTYSDGSSQVTQTRTATVTVKIQCQNPTVLVDNIVITYVGATISWLPTADEYEVSWKKSTESDWTSVTVSNVTSYTITGLEFEVTYNYKVQATCVTVDPTSYTFNTLAEPGLMVNGNIFGGGRMANVGGNTEIVIVNCDSIGGIFGGNDIAGKVLGTNGAKIALGVNTGDDYATYGTTPTGVTLKFGDVYGGGNGYYAYDGSSFEAASSDYTSYTVEPGESVKAMTLSHQVGDIVWTNTGSASMTLDFPSIVKTEIRVRDNYVIADSIFGGAKNAFLTTNSGDGSLITIDGGTIMAVFGGNNYGGAQGYGQHHIVVNRTTTSLIPNIENTATTGYGRDFGIRYLFGGGNKVYGSTTNVEIFGGQCDSIFAGGNSADVYAANVKVDCEMGALSTDYTYGDLYSNAIDTYASGIITPKENYGWDGFGGIYNVRTLFGGNNMATFDSHLNIKVPEITLTSGSLGTVYGGGNSGDMWGYSATGTTINGETVNYGTHVKMNSPTVLVDYLYGGCQMSDVRYSTWVELNDGHVGTVYGGCNISGDVGSTRVDLNAAQFLGEDDPNPEYQKVYGGTYVVVSGGTVYKNLFAGGNGFYHCLDDNGVYQAGLDYTNHNYVGHASPTHNETHVVVNTGATIKGNVYAGGNLACVGFNNNTAPGIDNPFPRFVGLSSVRMNGGHVYGNVYGGCNMSDVYGSNEVRVSGGTIDKSLYGGNDRLGRVATPISNRVLPADYQVASDGVTSLIDPKVYTYVGLTGNPSITNVYGGGNGDYAYFATFEEAEAYTGDKETVVSCDISNLPIQQCTFVDVGVDGGDANGAHIGTVYGGGDGVTVTGFAKVFFNVQNDPIGYSNVGTIYGGNNKGDLLLVPDIILLNGQVNTVYGGCNMGAMTAGSDENAHTKTITSALGDTFEEIGSYVHLLASYDGDGTGPGTAVTPNIKVVDAIYGGCRMNGVTKNSLVLVDGSNFYGMTKGIFGGSDISGNVGGFSRVAVTGGTVDEVYGGGNGYYTYTSDGSVYTIESSPVLVATGVESAPTCANSGADILGGHVGTSTSNQGNVFGGGLGALTSTSGDVLVNVGRPTATDWTDVTEIYGNVYGGSALGSVNTNGDNSTTVNFLNGKLNGNLFGGGLGDDDNDDLGWVKGKVFVNISNSSQAQGDCFIDLRSADIFGCNNTNGSPQDDVTVHVWKTYYITGDYDGSSETVTGYAIDEVFGGGNLANYAPQAENAKILVHVHECLNTIRRVFAGGNAADATGVSVLIEGGRMYYVFGGGNGEVTAANVGSGGTNTEIQGGIIKHLYGGSNKNGDIAGPVITEINNNSGCTEIIDEFFGGASLAELNTEGITTTIECGTGTFGTVYGGSETADITGDVTLNIRGGTITNVFGGSKGTETDGADITGKVTLNLEGGDITNAFGGNNIKGAIADTIVVNVLDFGVDNCGLKLTNVYGGGNLADYAPTETTVGPVVNVMHIADAAVVSGNVYGGGKEAQVEANPIVNIGYDNTMSDYLSAISIPEGITLNPSNFRAFVTGRVFGGGEEAGVTGNTTVNMNNGSVVTGIYGGCYTSGTVSGNANVNIYDGTIGTSTSKGYIFGGGYGQPTVVAGNVTVNFGDLDTYVNANPTLYGELYGGSALGTVNTNSSNSTRVNVANGTIAGIPTSSTTYDYGKVFGGGLGSSSVAAVVNGKVFVRIGNGIAGDFNSYTGKANLASCDVYGCNNVNGSPQSEVQVDVYQTAHNSSNIASNLNGSYAIHEVFGGGNQSPYMVDRSLKTNVWIHGCDNTISRVFGGGNAADVYGVNLTIDGGRLGEVFGGGNGELGPDYAANVGNSSTIGTEVITVLVGGGVINVLFQGSNQHGVVHGDIRVTNFGGCESLNIVDHFMGANQADIEGNITATINCGLNFDPYDPDWDPNSGDTPTGQLIEMKFVNLYCGSNRAQIRGDINLTIEGGIFENLFGGSKGRIDNPETTEDETFESNIDGNINLIITGGTIGNLYGGCDQNGNVKGKIGINIYENSDAECPLFIGNIYGGGRLTNTAPTDPTIISPDIKILKGDIGGTTSNLPVLNYSEPTFYAGNVFGGGFQGHVTSNPRVIVGDGTNKSVNVLGNVYGGGEEGEVRGSAQVIIVPKTYTFTYNTPENDNAIRVTDLLGNAITSSSTTLGEGMDLLIEALPSPYGQQFSGWTVDGENASVGDATATSTTFTMGTENSTLTPVFAGAQKHKLTITQPVGGHGSIAVYDCQGRLVDSESQISEGAVLNLSANPQAGYQLEEWTISGEGAQIRNRNVPHTIFTMGTGDASITASFQEIPTHQFTFGVDPLAGGSITATNASSQNVSSGDYIEEGSTLTLTATPATGYRFKEWVRESGDGIIATPNEATTSFTVRTQNTQVTAIFEEQP